MTRGVARLLCAVALAGAAAAVQAGAVEQLRQFVAQVKSGQARFEQTVTTPDGARRKSSSGTFEFARPDRFRFDYAKPYPQLVVSDGTQVWMHDPDLNQVSVRPFDRSLGATPAALLAGATLERDFDLAELPARDGLEWARATPKVADGAFQWMALGFRAGTLAAAEILDRFGQRTVLRLEGFQANPVLAAERFRFAPPPGAEVVPQ